MVLSNPSRSVFFGFGAWVGQITGATSCKWWADDPKNIRPPFDPAMQIDTDLAMNPAAVRSGAIKINQLQCDDAPPDGGLTKLGPKFPSGSMINSIWLEEGFYDRLGAAVKPPRIPPGVECREYELTTALYWSGALANRRFWGFHAEIVSPPQGSNALCSIWAAGRSLVRGEQPMGAYWLDLKTAAHPIEKGFTEIGVGASDPKQGALFLDAVTVRSISAFGPKLPPGHGVESFPSMPPRRAR